MFRIVSRGLGFCLIPAVLALAPIQGPWAEADSNLLSAVQCFGCTFNPTHCCGECLYESELFKCTAGAPWCVTPIEP